LALHSTCFLGLQQNRAFHPSGRRGKYFHIIKRVYHIALDSFFSHQNLPPLSLSGPAVWSTNYVHPILHQSILVIRCIRTQKTQRLALIWLAWKEINWWQSTNIFREQFLGAYYRSRFATISMTSLSIHSMTVGVRMEKMLLETKDSRGSSTWICHD